MATNVVVHKNDMQKQPSFYMRQLTNFPNIWGIFFFFVVVVEMQRDSNELKEPLSFLKSSSRD